MLEHGMFLPILIHTTSTELRNFMRDIRHLGIGIQYKTPQSGSQRIRLVSYNTASTKRSNSKIHPKEIGGGEGAQEGEGHHARLVHISCSHARSTWRLRATTARARMAKLAAQQARATALLWMKPGLKLKRSPFNWNTQPCKEGGYSRVRMVRK